VALLVALLVAMQHHLLVFGHGHHVVHWKEALQNLISCNLSIRPIGAKLLYYLNLLTF
jgi:hypothetical protein